jgi:hypothetical protein
MEFSSYTRARLSTAVVLAAVISVMASTAHATSGSDPYLYAFEAHITSLFGNVPVDLDDPVYGFFSYSGDLGNCGATGYEAALATYCNAKNSESSAGFTTGSLAWSTLSLPPDGYSSQQTFYAGRPWDDGANVYPGDPDSLSASYQTPEGSLSIFLTADNQNVWECCSNPGGYYGSFFPLIPTDLDLSDFVTKEMRYTSASGGFIAEIRGLRQVSPVPEPTAALLFGAGLCVAGMAARRSR